MSEQSNSLKDSNQNSVTIFRPSLLPAPSKTIYSSNGDTIGTNNSSDNHVSTTTQAQSSPVSPQAKQVANQNIENSVPSDYVFGSNISSRVVNADHVEGASSTIWSTSTSESKSSITESVFTDLAKVISNPSVNKPTESGTLEDSAKKVTDDQKQTLLNLSPVEVVTGEEDETQVYRQPCRTYIFDTDKQKWNNLGASHIHLNDTTNSKPPRSRVVVRLASTGKLLVNTPVWNDMPVALVESRSLRIGAVSNDGGQIKSYLLTFPVENIAAEIVETLQTRKRCCVRSDTEKTVSVGQKRSAQSSIDLPLPKVSAVERTMPKSPTISSTTSNLKTDIQQPAIFRPSVLTQTTSSTAVEEQLSCTSASGVHFRHSALDTAVKQFEELPSHSCLPQPTQQQQQLEDPSHSSTQSSSLNTLVHKTDLPDASFVFGENTAARVSNTESSSGEVQKNDDDNEVADDLGEPVSVQTLAHSASVVAAEINKLASDPKLSTPPIVHLRTGEEDECTALKTYCQFYSFDRTKHEWIERGPAYVHLNDIPAVAQEDSVARITTGPPMRSRLVARVWKTLKLLANTPIWSGMNVSMADQRSIRLTSMCMGEVGEDVPANASNQNSSTDNVGQPEFCAYLLVMRSPKEASRLYQALISRMTLLSTRHLDAKPDPPQSFELSSHTSHSPDF